MDSFQWWSGVTLNLVVLNPKDNLQIAIPTLC